LLEVSLDTGRMHQIRVHMAAIGFPVLGDPVYGRAPRIPGLTRQFLHAAKLELKHPVTGEPMQFESPLPEDLRNVLDAMRETSGAAR
jgi:23S rRNA pseudouridine1911/1915/1917 synthase